LEQVASGRAQFSSKQSQQADAVLPSLYLNLETPSTSNCKSNSTSWFGRLEIIHMIVHNSFHGKDLPTEQDNQLNYPPAWMESHGQRTS
jgi:hypothetical protein